MMTMGYRLRYFIAEDDGGLTRVPTARCHRWFSDDEALPPGRAAQELRLLEVVVNVDHQCSRMGRSPQGESANSSEYPITASNEIQ